MNILERLLKQFINIPSNLDEVTNKNIMEVDEYVDLIDASNLVIGHVLTCEKHPNADSLSVTTVNVGDEVLQIVCGAKNIKAGLNVIVAKIGAVLPNDFKIKHSTIRGVESFGMICSLNELGFDESVINDEDKSGIYAFKTPVVPGANALEVLGLDGKKLVLGMTTNRGDLLSHLGFAYDLASMLNLKVNVEMPVINEIEKKNDISVKIESDLAYKYDARVIEVTIKDSPWWLKNALIASEIRPINNVVDITNYILITYGTPLHAFDYEKIGSNEIVVKNALNDQKVVTLDKVERTLNESDLLITNGKDALAIAGVMGLLDSGVTENTTKILLEAALFNPSAVQKTSIKLGLKSDSSLRFERGIEQSRVRLGLEHATKLLVELADAKVYKGISSEERLNPENSYIEITVETINNKLGVSLTNDELIVLFERLNYTVIKGETLKVKAPEYRKDITIQADLVEEIARIYGYDAIPHHDLKLSLKGSLNQMQKQLRKTRHSLADFGLTEVINYSLISREEVESFNKFGEEISVLTPMSDQRSILRQSLIPGLLKNINHHINRQMENVNIFEIGHVFYEGIETNHLAVAMYGNFYDTLWQQKNINADYYLISGMLERLGYALNIDFSITKNENIAGLHPGITGNIVVNNQVVGYIGRIHPSEEKKLDLKSTYVFEINLDKILGNANKINYEAISKFPSVTRDISFVISNEYAIGDVINLIKQTGRKVITNVELFDIYQGDKIESGKSSVGISITFNNKEKTLEKEDVEKTLKSIKNRLGFEFKAVLRD